MTSPGPQPLELPPSEAPLPPTAAPILAAPTAIRIRGARTHNLKNVDLDLPHGKLIVVTGPSGCGKSSLAFDTLFVEGQRQYVESLSIEARQLLQTWERPDVDLVDGLPPVIAIDQRGGAQHPRSTVATLTEIHDYLRVLMARAGEPFCPGCQASIRHQTPEQIVADALELPLGTRMLVLAPLVGGGQAACREAFEQIRKAGFVRARLNGETLDLDRARPPTNDGPHAIDAVVDRLAVRDGIRTRLAESVLLAIKHGRGAVTISVERDGGWDDRAYCTTYACPRCGLAYEELEPRTFSFNSPYGACPECDGLGLRAGFDAESVIPDFGKSLRGGAVAAWQALPKGVATRHEELVRAFVEAARLDWETPLAEWPQSARRELLCGAGEFPGVLRLLEQADSTSDDEEAAPALELFRGETICSECHGARLKAEARHVRVAGRALHEMLALPIEAAAEFFRGLKLTGRDALVAAPLVEHVESRLGFLRQVGLGYLTLDRRANTLSGGELQRVRLASAIGAGLVGACYILDEPSIGLHPRDNALLIASLRRLQSLGSTVIVVEHDESVMRAADELIDVGPAAGALGGRIVGRGSPEELARQLDSPTGRYLSGASRAGQRKPRRTIDRRHALVLDGATAHNLKNIDVWFPLGTLCCVTGVSGSGKSTLIHDTLAPAVQRKLTGMGQRPLAHRSLRGVERIDKLVVVDQSPIGRTPRSNPATYTGLFDLMRKTFAATREARLRGYGAGRFSFNAKGGRCEECRGHGVVKLDMAFLPELRILCPQCRGARFNRQTLEIRFKEKSLAEVLAMSVDEALLFFENQPAMKRMLATLNEVGLGYLTLGQPADTLSGGEAQRIKLAAELGRPDTGATLYVLDEPTTGLHFDDVQKLLLLLQRLVDLGNTVIAVEHHLNVLMQADWIIDLGPDGGAAGGQLQGAGPPEDIAQLAGSATGECLHEALASG